MAKKPRTVVIAPDGMSARRMFTNDWLMPVNMAGQAVRHIYNTSSLRYEKMYHERSGLPFGPLWVGPDAHRMNPVEINKVVELASEFGLELKNYRQHPNFQNWPLRCAVDPEFDIAHRQVFIADNQRVAEAVALVDWGMPSDFMKRVRVVNGTDGLERLYGYDGKGKTIWLGPNFISWLPARRQHLTELAYHRGFALNEFYKHPMYHKPGMRLLP